MKTITITAKITRFDPQENGTLKVYFGNGLHATAHPALRVKEYMGDPIALEICPTEKGWVLVYPKATAEQKEAWKNAQLAKQRTEAQATAEQEAEANDVLSLMD